MGSCVYNEMHFYMKGIGHDFKPRRKKRICDKTQFRKWFALIEISFLAVAKETFSDAEKRKSFMIKMMKILTSVSKTFSDRSLRIHLLI